MVNLKLWRYSFLVLSGIFHSRRSMLSLVNVHLLHAVAKPVHRNTPFHGTMTPVLHSARVRSRG